MHAEQAIAVTEVAVDEGAGMAWAMLREAEEDLQDDEEQEQAAEDDKGMTARKADERQAPEPFEGGQDYGVAGTEGSSVVPSQTNAQDDRKHGGNAGHGPAFSPAAEGWRQLGLPAAGKSAGTGWWSSPQTAAEGESPGAHGARSVRSIARVLNNVDSRHAEERDEAGGAHPVEQTHRTLLSVSDSWDGVWRCGPQGPRSVTGGNWLGGAMLEGADPRGLGALPEDRACARPAGGEAAASPAASEEHTAVSPAASAGRARSGEEEEEEDGDHDDDFGAWRALLAEAEALLAKVSGGKRFPRPPTQPPPPYPFP
jgi:hypothetical protein